MKALAGKLIPTLIAPLIASALAGCASGGGGGGGGDRGDDVACVIAGPLCAFFGSSGDTTGGGPTFTNDQFTSWANLKPNAITNINGLIDDGYYVGPTVSSVAYDQNGAVIWFGTSWIQKWPSDSTNLAVNGQPAIKIRTLEGTVEGGRFTDLPASQTAAIADPYELGWNYQTFGIWNNGDPVYGSVDHMHGLTALSVGNPTAASAIPTTGAATFTGKLAGAYYSLTSPGGAATADLKVSVDFSARSLNFASTGTMTTRDLVTATAVPGLNLTGTLAYSAGTNSFSGTLTSANGMTGTSKGQFYGPNAQELGGLFTVASGSDEIFKGAYGAKR